jgi:hypothetical protein
MSYEDALADLKAEFGKKTLLTPEDIAPYIDKSPAAQAALRTRKRFPFATKTIGGRIVVSIYDLARYIGGEPSAQEAPAVAAVQAVAKQPHKGTQGAEKYKPYRRPPSLGKALMALRKKVIDAALQLQFQQAVFAQLEAIELDRVTRPRRREPKKQS